MPSIKSITLRLINFCPFQEYQGATVLLGILMLLMSCLIIVIGYLNFKNIQEKTTSFMQKVFQRGQYTHILSRPEENEVHV